MADPASVRSRATAPIAIGGTEAKCVASAHVGSIAGSTAADLPFIPGLKKASRMPLDPVLIKVCHDCRRLVGVACGAPALMRCRIVSKVPGDSAHRRSRTMRCIGKRVSENTCQAVR